MQETNPDFFKDWNKFKPNLGSIKNKDEGRPVGSDSSVLMIENTFEDDFDKDQDETFDASLI